MARALSAVLLPVSLGIAAAESVVQAEMPLRATAFTPDPEYHGDLPVSGTVSVGRDQIGTQVLFFDLLGTDGSCGTNHLGDTPNACGIHIHTGSTCDHVGENFYSAATLATDPWVDVTYTNVDGKATGRNVRVTTGETLAELKGRTVVVYDSNGARVACAPLVQDNATGLALVPTLGEYPGYEGELVVNGTVDVAQEGVGVAGAQVLRFNLTGVDTHCDGTAHDDVPNACGIHIHEGTNCSDATQVGGHYYDTAHITSDPWASIQYVAFEDRAVGLTTPVVTGEALSSVVGRAFVVHDVSGARIACGIIQAAKAPGDGSGAIVALAASGPSPRAWALAASALLLRAAL